MSQIENRKTVMHCIELFNKNTLEWVDTCYSKGLEWVEMPQPGTPKGRHGNFNFYRESAGQALRLFPDQKLSVLRSVTEGDCVVFEQEWQGTAALTVRNYVAGRMARQRIVSFFTLKDGLIVKQTDYCTSAP